MPFQGVQKPLSSTSLCEWVWMNENEFWVCVLVFFLPEPSAQPLMSSPSRNSGDRESAPSPDLHSIWRNSLSSVWDRTWPSTDLMHTYAGLVSLHHFCTHKHTLQTQRHFTDRWRRQRWAWSAVCWVIESQPNVGFYCWSYLPPSCWSCSCCPRWFPAAWLASPHRTRWTDHWRTCLDSSLRRTVTPWRTDVQRSFMLLTGSKCIRRYLGCSRFVKLSARSRPISLSTSSSQGEHSGIHEAHWLHSQWLFEFLLWHLSIRKDVEKTLIRCTVIWSNKENCQGHLTFN